MCSLERLLCTLGMNPVGHFDPLQVGHVCRQEDKPNLLPFPVLTDHWKAIKNATFICIMPQFSLQAQVVFVQGPDFSYFLT